MTATLAPASPRTRSALGLVFVVVACGAVLALRTVGREPADLSMDPSDPNVPLSAQIEETYGVRFTGVALTGSGGILQIRFLVLDESKALALHEESTEPYLVVDGTRLDAPALAGHVHSAPTVAGRLGSVLLANSDSRAHRGSVVSLHIGELTIQRVVVE